MVEHRRKLENPYLPVEILSNILIRIPVKDILRFKTICKSWHGLFTSPDFISVHSHHLKENHAHILVSDDFLYAANLDSLNSHPIKVDLEGLLIDDIVGSCNGLLLCVRKDDSCLKLTDQLVIVNPSTLVYRLIPKVKGRLTQHSKKHYGFGYDYVGDDHKIVRIVDIYGRDEVRVVVYSLRADSWKFIDAEIPYGYLYSERKYGALIDNHLLHWAFDKPRQSRICCFDICVEQWSEVPLPDDCSHIKSREPVYFSVSSIEVLDGCLCVQAQYICGRQGYYGDPMVYVMKEYGVKDSWVKLRDEWSTVIPPHSWKLPPISTKSGREILCRTDSYKGYFFFWYDMDENRTREVRIHGVPYHSRSSVCIRSLISPWCYGRTDDQIKSTKIERGSTSVRRSARIRNKSKE